MRERGGGEAPGAAIGFHLTKQRVATVEHRYTGQLHPAGLPWRGLSLEAVSQHLCCAASDRTHA